MALSEFFQRQRTYTPSASAVRKRIQWETKGAQYLAGYSSKVPKGSLVRPDPDVAAKIQALTVQAFPVIGRAFDRHMGALAVSSFDEWPVASGFSKSLLALEYDAGTETLTSSVVCLAPYAYFIRRPTKKDRPKERRLRGEELDILNKPPEGFERKLWQQSCVAASRNVSRISYAYVVGVYRRVEAATTKRRRPRRGKKVADQLVFKPGRKTAEDIAADIAQGLGD